MAELVDLDVELIDAPLIAMHPDPPIEHLKELADSIKQTGQWQEITVRKTGDRYQVVIGHNRVRAAKMGGIPTLRARIQELSDKEALLATATENIGRLEHDPVKEAEIFSALQDKYGMSETQIAEKFGKSAGYIKGRLNLLLLAPEIQTMIQNKELQLSVASEIARIGDPVHQLLVASDLRDRKTTANYGKAIVSGFLEYKEKMPDAPTDKLIEKAREEAKTVCHFCDNHVLLTRVKLYNCCTECYRNIMYLLEKERREAQSSQESE